MSVSLRLKTGFTLIEVLIALVILSVALTAVIQSTTENIRHTRYLQNKTIASWVGTNVINQIRSGILKISGRIEQKTLTLGQEWRWQAELTPTANIHIKKIDVLVYEKNQSLPLSHLVSYLYAHS